METLGTREIWRRDVDHKFAEGWNRGLSFPAGWVLFMCVSIEIQRRVRFLEINNGLTIDGFSKIA